MLNFLKKCHVSIFIFAITVNFLLFIVFYQKIAKNENEKNRVGKFNNFSSSLLIKSKNNKTWHVEIWSKSAIGQYLWENILNGRTESKLLPNNLYIEGRKTIGSVTFLFRSGPSLKPESFPLFNIDNLILILNWRSKDKINYAEKWLDAIVYDKSFNASLKNLGIIALGNEHCRNDWFIEKYHELFEKNLRFLSIIYDWQKVDNQVIFQWPLGTATYRNFPSNFYDDKFFSIDIQKSRPYICNFIATVYPNSTREDLEKLFKQEVWLQKKCLVKTRHQWKPNEADDSMNAYVEALKSSDLTLSPVGMNHECYRILEAVEYGSIPVIEYNIKYFFSPNNQCDKTETLRLFKETKAPFIFVRNWTNELLGVLSEFESKPLEAKVKQRIDLLKWYHKFKIRFKNKLVNMIQQKFK